MPEFNGKFELVDPRLINIDHRYQRPEKETLVATIGQDFNWPAFGVVVCYQRNSRLYAVDGQQRLAAAMSQDPAPKKVPCLIFPEQNLVQEASTFLEMQVNRKAVSAIEKHRAELQAKVPSALAIERALSKASFTIGIDSKNPRTIAAVRTLHSIYDLIGEEGLVQVLVQVREAWPTDLHSSDVNMLIVVGEIISDQWPDRYERQKLTKQLSRTSPGEIVQKSKAFEFEMGGSRRENIRRAVKALAKV